MSAHRYKVCDNDGVLRTFYRKEEAEAFMRNRPELILKVVQGKKKPKLDLNKFEPAPF